MSAPTATGAGWPTIARGRLSALLRAAWGDLPGTAAPGQPLLNGPLPRGRSRDHDRDRQLLALGGAKSPSIQERRHAAAGGDNSLLILTRTTQIYDRRNDITLDKVERVII